jgi:tetratricopeptide (TPR) repeat protein
MKDEDRRGAASREGLLGRAKQLEQAGRFGEAAAAYEQVLARWPDLPNSWYNLALLQRRTGRYEAALASYAEALTRGASQPEEIHLNRGVIYADDLRNETLAEREIRAALRLNPGYAPALLNLANLSEDRGRREEALGVYERLLALYPEHFDALARYASLKGASEANDPLAEQLRQAIGRAGAAEKASLGFALGKILDGVGAYDDAFAAYSQANRASAESAGGAGYDPAAHELFVDALIEAFPVANEPPTPAKAPALFICGMFRSGSTLIEHVLAGHPRVTAGGEAPFLPDVVARLAPFPQSLKGLHSSQLNAIADQYRQSVAHIFAGADIVTDKRPDNFLYLGLIKSLFPDAKIVHTTRNALDNCLSVFFLHLDPGMSYALKLETIGHYYRQYRRLMQHWDRLWPGDIHHFDYDAFVRQPEATLRPLINFLDLDWNDALLAFNTRESVVKTASVWQVREALYQRASGRWRNYQRHLAPLLTALGEEAPALD